jgi:hypothetical protein
MAQQPTRRKMYRTMQGRMVDIEKLRASNEGVRAVGNMNVNARGDMVGSGGQIVKTKEEQMKEYYEAPKGQASDARSTRVREAKPQPIPQPRVVQTQVLNPQASKPAQAKTTNQFKPKQGIDAALDGIE